jgi:rod shape-determining protein MreC
MYYFLTKTKNFFLFLLLAGICVYSTYKTSVYKQGILNSVAWEIAYPVLKLRTEWSELLHLRIENRRLMNQNKNLLMLVFNHRRSFEPPENIDYGDSLSFTYYPATVIENTVNKRNNYLILYKGSADGIRPGMGVISPEGIVGTIKDVSPNFSMVLSLLHSDFQIAAKIKNRGISGLLTWDGVNIQYAQMINLAHIDNVKVADTVITRESLVYPSDYPIGTIAEISPATKGGYFVLKVKLLTPFDNLRNVYIIRQNYSEELDNLMEKFHEED